MLKYLGVLIFFIVLFNLLLLFFGVTAVLVGGLAAVMTHQVLD